MEVLVSVTHLEKNPRIPRGRDFEDTNALTALCSETETAEEPSSQTMAAIPVHADLRPLHLFIDNELPYLKAVMNNAVDTHIA